MIAIGVTGGLGSGKSTVVRLLAGHGAVTIDADALARAALEPGTEAFTAVVERFGAAIVDPGGRIDRRALAALVFADAQARADVEAIVHPVVTRGIDERLESAAETDAVVVLDLPLLIETGGRHRYGLSGVLVVDTPADLAIERVVHERGITAEDARARLDAQADPGERLRAADFIIMNHGTTDELAEMTDGAWRWIERLVSERRGG